MLRKFDNAYFEATQRLAFTKYVALCGLEARHGVNVGTSYRNENAGKTLCYFIAQSRWEFLWSSLGNETLDDLLMLNTDALSLSQFNLMKALICGGKLPQDVQTNHREGYARNYRSSGSPSDCATSSEAQKTENPDTSEIFSINNWDNWST